MALEPLAGFRSFYTHHCVTGSMRHIYDFNHYEISEEMLLGLGAGVSFSYWHFKGQPPFMGGRGGFKPPLEETSAQRTGVLIERHTTTSVRKARKSLVEMLEAGRPVMIQCDMGFLPYFDFGGEEYHFGGHVVVVCGYDPETDQVLVADRDEEFHPVSMEALAQARGSTYRPFPPKNCWFSFDFSEMHPPKPEAIRQAIGEMAQGMFEAPISNIGLKGIRKAAKMIPKWPEQLGEDMLKFALFNAHIFISPVGGTGGGNFRYMLSRFLVEAAELLGEPALEQSAAEFKGIGDQWEAVGEWFLQTSEVAQPVARLGECVEPLLALAELETEAWSRLRELVQ